jgi:hypothetical protein
MEGKKRAGRPRILGDRKLKNKRVVTIFNEFEYAKLKAYARKHDNISLYRLAKIAITDYVARNP